MKVLIVEDDYASRMVLQKLLAPYGETDMAENGEEAITAFLASQESGNRYDVICLDIMMPEKDGQTVLKEVRAIESVWGIEPGKGARVIMTTALSDKENLLKAVQQCDAYLVKPINRNDLLFYLKKFGLVK